jgi:hypothetical protein
MNLSEAFHQFYHAAAEHGYRFQINQNDSFKVGVWPRGRMELAKIFRGGDNAVQALQDATEHMRQ